MASEFDLIARYFTRPAHTASLGVGDDAALIRPTPGMELAVSTDMLLAGRHFFPDVDPESLGHKALAVNLSDLAAMGATPRWAVLSIALPEADEAWLRDFSKGLFALADRHGVELIGGDTTRGPLNISLTILGEVAVGQALRRDAGRVGDDVWVSGALGGAALGLRYLQGKIALSADDATSCLSRLHTPEPRVALGLLLSGIAHAAIDISDGLLGDLGHILERSGLAAELDLAALPAAAALATRLPDPGAQACLLAGGDDYELCFSAPPARRDAVLAAAHQAGVSVHRVGCLIAGSGLRVMGSDGLPIDLEITGFDHFAS